MIGIILTSIGLYKLLILYISKNPLFPDIYNKFPIIFIQFPGPAKLAACNFIKEDSGI